MKENTQHSSDLSVAQTSFDMNNILSGDARQLLNNQADVSLTLSKHLMLNYGQNSNLVFSPISIQVVLGLIAAGSTAQTLNQLLSFLKANSIDDLNHLYSHLVDFVYANGKEKEGGPCLSFANGVWLDESVSLKPQFKHVVDNLYKAASYQVDFKKKAGSAVSLVNLWVKEKTNGLIEEILSSGAVNSFTRLIFANALYFKGAWSCGFDKSSTRHRDFHLLNGDSIKVPFMTSHKDRCIKAFDGFKVLKLPYRQSINNNHPFSSMWQDTNYERSFSMCIFLPDAKDGLPALVEKAGSESGFIERHIPNWPVDVRSFWIPKFKFKYEIEVSEALQELGLDLPFDPSVGLSEIVDAPEPYVVSKIFQKAFIEVNEEGTEAAAASCCAMYTPTSPNYVRPRIDFVADHPFLFVIRENVTGIVQFIGHVLDPSQT